jgi:CcmD family protein
VNNLNYLIGAYLLFWLFTTGYLLTLERRQKEIERKLGQNS